MARGAKLVGLGAMLALAGGAAHAENLDAGKSAQALFASTCSACHSSPRGLAKDRGPSGLASFLQEHYTSGPQSAASLAGYLIANPGSPQRAKQTPAERAEEKGAKRGEAKTERQTHVPQSTTMRPDSMIEPIEPRRPAESAKGHGKQRQQTKQEPPVAPPASGEPAATAATPPPAPTAPAPAPTAAPVAAAPPPADQPAFSAPSP